MGVHLVDVRDQPLHAHEVLEAVADPECGGVNLFLGIVRDHDHGRSVVSLDYSAHPSAVAELQAVATEVAEEYAAHVAVVHRIGSLVVGDTAVALAAAAAHRDGAYAASRALIDRLKERVPIWKHQTFADGTEEWVNCL